MPRFEAERAMLARWAAGVEGLQPPPKVAWSIAECLGAAIRIETLPGVAPGYRLRRDGTGHITLPLVSDELVEALLLLEEIGHHVCHGPFPAPPRVHPLRGRPGDLRAAELWERILEGEAARFVSEAVLPAAEMLRLRCEADWIDALEATGLETRTLQERLRALMLQPVAFPTAPPAWCAWPHYRLRWYAAPLPHFEIRGADGGLFLLNCREDEREAVGEQLLRDLGAWTPREFALKYRAARASSGVDYGRPWGEVFASTRTRRR